MPKIYRVAVIGSTKRGNYGHGIDTVWKDVPETKVVAVADEDEAGREAAVKRLEAPKGYADYRQMLEVEKPDIVAIGPRWIDRHYEMALEAASRGCHIYMEKPFVRTLTEADELVRRCDMSHVKLALAHQTRYSPTLPTVMKMIADGLLGTVLEIRGRGKEDGRGGPEDLWVLGSHVLNLIATFAGEPTHCFASVTANGKPITKENVVEGNEGLGPLAGDSVTATIGFRSGIQGYFASRRGQAGSPSRFGIQIFGSKGVIEIISGFADPVWYLPDPTWSPGRSGRGWQSVSSQGIGKPETASKGLHAGNVAAVRDLLRAIETNKQPLCSASDGRVIIELIMSIFESARTRNPVTFPLASREHPLRAL